MGAEIQKFWLLPGILELRDGEEHISVARQTAVAAIEALTWLNEQIFQRCLRAQENWGYISDGTGKSTSPDSFVARFN
ncbi:hypothetical protein Ancab_034848 [Ancistrocladus abbreviatus]